MLRRKRKRVLLLDDDPSMQRLVKSLLEGEGYHVDAFLTGREAIGALGKNDYAVLLLDLMMPHEGGMTVIRHLRSRNPDLLKRSLLFTGSPRSVIGAVRGEVAGVVKKPFQPPELIGAVGTIAESV